jgi:DNA damage-binding protein 1
MRLEKLASYRTSTAPVDVTVTGNLIAVSDLMKSMCLVEYKEGENGTPDTMTEVARHFQTVWATGVANIAPDTFLESDAEGNLIVLHRNTTGVEEDDKRRLEVTGEISLGEMVNRIRPVNIQQLASVAVTPRAFLGTVSFSLVFVNQFCETTDRINRNNRWKALFTYLLSSILITKTS